jgi:hypothetical protein
MIRSETLVQPNSVSVNPIIGLILIAIGLTIVGIFLAVPLYFIARGFAGRSVADRVKCDSVAKFKKFIGETPQYFDCESVAWNKDPTRLTGTGIAYTAKAIYILDNGMAAEIPWSAIREWRWRIEGYSQTRLIGGNTGQRIENDVINTNAKVVARTMSGFFVLVSNINKPEWQFTSANETTLKKWNEIFTQINEGRLEIAT